MAYKDSLTSTGSSKRDSYLDPELQCLIENDAGTRVMKEVATKREIRRARLLFEATAQSQSPSKDFVALLITEMGIIWSKWKITLRGYTSGGAPVPQPLEEVMSFSDFKCNDALQDEVRRSFGASTLHHIERIISGSNDILSCTPEPLMLQICSMLDLESISQLSKVNRHFRRLCASDKLWSILYLQQQGTPSPEICDLADEISWKKVFYLSKLQLQKEISRRRRTMPRTSESDVGGRKLTMPQTSAASEVGRRLTKPRTSTEAEVGGRKLTMSRTGSQVSRTGSQGSGGTPSTFLTENP